MNELIQLKLQAWLIVEEAEVNSSKIYSDTLEKRVIRSQLDFYCYAMGAKCLLKLFFKTKVFGNKRIDLNSSEPMEILVTILRTCELPAAGTKQAYIKRKKLMQ